MRDKRPKGKKPHGVGIDFKKAKSKIGKKLPKADNETNTKIQSRTINLPGQSVNADRAGLVLSSRNLSLKELLGQCQHYSDLKRADGLQGIKEVLGSDPAVLAKEAGTVVEHVAELAADSSKGVRAALASLLGDLVLPRLGRDRVAPFLPLLMAHIGSAMTHLDGNVRTSALWGERGLLDLLLQHAAGLVAVRFQGQVLEHFAHMMSSKGRAVSERGMVGALQAIASLHRFLSATHPGGAAGAGGGGGARARAGALERGLAVLDGGGGGGGGGVGPPKVAWGVVEPPGNPVLCGAWWRDPPAELHPLPPGWGRSAAPVNPAAGVNAAAIGGALGVVASVKGAVKDPRLTAPASMGVNLVMERLWDVFNECAPAQQALTPEATAVKILALVLRCCGLALGRGGGGEGAEELEVEGRVAWLHKWARAIMPHFPFPMPAVTTTVPIIESLRELNLAGAALLQLAVETRKAGCPAWGDGAFPPPPAVKEGRRASGGGEPGAPWEAVLLDFLTFALVRGQTVPAEGLSALESEEPVGVLTAEVAAELLELIERSLPLASPERRMGLLAAVTDLAGRSDPRSGARLLCLATQHRLSAAQAGAPLKAIVPWDLAGSWLQSVPRLLWQLGAAQPATTALALRMMLDCARLAPVGSPVSDLLVQLQPTLQPFFCAAVAKKGAKRALSADTGERAVPLVKLPPEVQRLSIDVVYHMPQVAAATLRSVALCVLHPGLSADVAQYAVEVVGARSLAGPATGAPLPPALVLSFLLTLLVGELRAVEGASGEGGFERDEAVVRAACGALVMGTDPHLLMELLQPALAHHLEVATTWRALHGLLSAASSAAASAAAAGRPIAGEMAAAPAQHLWRYVASAPRFGGGGREDDMELEGVGIEDVATGTARPEGARADAVATQLLAACPGAVGPFLRCAAAGGGGGGAAARVAALGAALRDPRLAAAVLGAAAEADAAACAVEAACAAEPEGPEGDAARDACMGMRSHLKHLLGGV